MSNAVTQQEHKAWITEHLGADLAESAQYGWLNTTTEYATKIVGWGILTTEIETGEMDFYEVFR